MYTIKQASERSGVGIPLLRAWERRYGVIVPMRTTAGYRLYDDAAINRLQAMRRLIDDGWSARQAAERLKTLDDASVTALIAPVTPTSTAVVDGTRAPDADAQLRERFVQQIVGGAKQLDASEVEQALDEAFAVARFEVVAERALMPALQALGDAWERGDVTVAGEHLASHAILRRLSQIYESAAVPDRRPPILVGLAPGARHELGALTFAIGARRAGLPVLYLGPDLPGESWVAAATQRQAPAAVLAVPRPHDASAGVEVVRALRRAAPPTLIAVGGRGAGAAARREPALVLSQGPIGSVDQLRQALAERR